MQDISQVKLIDLCPSSLRNDSQIIAMCDAVQPEFDQIDQAIQSVLFIPNLTDLPDDVLELLAWERNLGGDDGWLLAKSKEQKARLIRDAYKLQKYKGTKYAVKKALELVGLSGEVQEWFEYGGDRYTFKLNINGMENYSNTQLELLDIYILTAKNTRSWAIVVINQAHTMKLNVAVGWVEVHHSEFKTSETQALVINLETTTTVPALTTIFEELTIGD
jgi:phage tail P2-like protein